MKTEQVILMKIQEEHLQSAADTVIAAAIGANTLMAVFFWKNFGHVKGQTLPVC